MSHNNSDDIDNLRTEDITAEPSEQTLLNDSNDQYKSNTPHTSSDSTELQPQLDLVTSELKLKEDRINDLNNQIQSNQNEINLALSTITILKEKLNSVEKESLENDQIIEKQSLLLSQENQKVRDIQQNLNNMTKQYQDLYNQSNTLRSEIIYKDSKYKDMEDKFKYQSEELIKSQNSLRQWLLVTGPEYQKNIISLNNTLEHERLQYNMNQNNYETFILTLQKQIKGLKSSNETLTNDNTALLNKNKQLEAELESFNSRHFELTRQEVTKTDEVLLLNNEKDLLLTKYNQLNDSIKEMKDKHQKETSIILEKSQRDIIELKNQHYKDLDEVLALSDKYKSEITELKSKLSNPSNDVNEISKLKEKYEKDFLDLKNLYNTEKNDVLLPLIEKYKQITNNDKEKIKDLESNNKQLQKKVEKLQLERDIEWLSIELNKLARAQAIESEQANNITNDTANVTKTNTNSNAATTTNVTKNGQTMVSINSAPVSGTVTPARRALLAAAAGGVPPVSQSPVPRTGSTPSSPPLSGRGRGSYSNLQALASAAPTLPSVKEVDYTESSKTLEKSSKSMMIQYVPSSIVGTIHESENKFNNSINNISSSSSSTNNNNNNNNNSNNSNNQSLKADQISGKSIVRSHGGSTVGSGTVTPVRVLPLHIIGSSPRIGSAPSSPPASGRRKSSVSNQISPFITPTLPSLKEVDYTESSKTFITAAGMSNKSLLIAHHSDLVSELVASPKTNNLLLQAPAINNKPPNSSETTPTATTRSVKTSPTENNNKNTTNTTVNNSKSNSPRESSNNTNINSSKPSSNTSNNMTNTPATNTNTNTIASMKSSLKPPSEPKPTQTRPLSRSTTVSTATPTNGVVSDVSSSNTGGNQDTSPMNPTIGIRKLSLAETRNTVSFKDNAIRPSSPPKPSLSLSNSTNNSNNNNSGKDQMSSNKTATGKDISNKTNSAGSKSSSNKTASVSVVSTSSALSSPSASTFSIYSLMYPSKSNSTSTPSTIFGPNYPASPPVSLRVPSSRSNSLTQSSLHPVMEDYDMSTKSMGTMSVLTGTGDDDNKLKTNLIHRETIQTTPLPLATPTATDMTPSTTTASASSTTPDKLLDVANNNAITTKETVVQSSKSMALPITATASVNDPLESQSVPLGSNKLLNKDLNHEQQHEQPVDVSASIIQQPPNVVTKEIITDTTSTNTNTTTITSTNTNTTTANITTTSPRLSLGGLHATELLSTQASGLISVISDPAITTANNNNNNGSTMSPVTLKSLHQLERNSFHIDRIVAPIDENITTASMDTDRIS